MFRELIVKVKSGVLPAHSEKGYVEDSIPDKVGLDILNAIFKVSDDFVDSPPTVFRDYVVVKGKNVPINKITVELTTDIISLTELNSFSRRLSKLGKVCYVHIDSHDEDQLYIKAGFVPKKELGLGWEVP